MKHVLSNEKYIFSFSKENNQVLNVKSGDRVKIATLDCFANQIQMPQDTLEKMDWNRVNPATGPIYVEEAMTGDVLRVTIEKIEISNQGVVATGKDLGVLGDRIDGLKSKILQIKDGEVVFDEKLSIPVKPMIGVIGVAPDQGEINCGTPGHHGGNMDNTMIGEKTILYFPVFIKGALFALGDLHAVMGDGEIGVSGVEVAGNVEVKLEVVRNMKLYNPCLENDECFATIASGDNLDLAISEAVSDMEKILSKQIKMPKHEIAMLLSLVGNAEVCQVVDPLRTARFVVPKWVLEKYNFYLMKEEVKWK